LKFVQSLQETHESIPSHFEVGVLLAIPKNYDYDDEKVPCLLVKIERETASFLILREESFVRYFFEEIKRYGILTWDEYVKDSTKQ